MTELYDAIVIGGGVNGTGLVRDLARRGFRAVLFEKGDFAPLCQPRPSPDS